VALRPTLLSTTVLTGLATILSLPATLGHAADLMLFKAPAAPAQMPAVDGLNGKVDGFGGAIGDRAVLG
jgi:hypothetical protein